MTKIQTLYHEKDIRFLLHEPIVWKFRDFKVSFFAGCWLINLGKRCSSAEQTNVAVELLC